MEGAGAASSTRSLGELVLARRRSLGLSQARLASACGVSQKTISLIEAGQTKEPRLGLLEALARALQLPRSELERCALRHDAPVAATASPDIVTATSPRSDASVARGGTAVHRLARELLGRLLGQAVNHRGGDVVDLVRQTATYLAVEYSGAHRSDRASMELAIDSAWIVGRTYANVLKRRLDDGDAYFDRAAAMAREIGDWDRWAQAVWRKANHHRKLDDLIVAHDRNAASAARTDYDVALVWLENVVDSKAADAWRSVAHAECAKIAVSTHRERLFAQHIQAARELAARASTAGDAPTWPPFLQEYAEVLWRDRYLLGMAVFGEGSDAEMRRLLDEARQFRNGLTAPFDRVMLPLSQTLRDVRSSDREERERGARRGWQVILRARAMGLDNFAGIAARALRDAGLLETGRQLYEAETRSRART